MADQQRADDESASDETPETSPGRNLVVCLDGTSNEPESGATNVVRIYDIAVKNDRQLVYYDPGVGTMGARAAITRTGQFATRVAGLVAGYGVKDDIEEAYTFLMNAYGPGDRIFVFGFSRGAYTARALVGMLGTVGLLRPGAENLVPYACKLYTRKGMNEPTKSEASAYWKVRRDFNSKFGNPDFPNLFSKNRKQVQFLGVWDTVKSVGWLNWHARFVQARWPYTAKLDNVRFGRHALAIDERRRPFAEYRFHREELEKNDGRLREMWFTGVHSDVGGQFPDDHRLSDIAMKWMVDEAVAAGFDAKSARYRTMFRVPVGGDLSDETALGRIHTNQRAWGVLGWHHRRIREGDEVHPSVCKRILATQNDRHPYYPSLPNGNYLANE